MSIQHYNKESKELTNIDVRDLIDAKTGELVQAQQIFKRIYGQKQFWKCYLMDFMAVLGIIDSRQLDIFIYICENTNPSNNQFAGTYKKISKELKVSERTIATILKKLQNHNFIKRVQNGLWAINPKFLMKGNERKRQILLSYYWE